MFQCLLKIADPLRVVCFIAMLVFSVGHAGALSMNGNAALDQLPEGSNLSWCLSGSSGDEAGITSLDCAFCGIGTQATLGSSGTNFIEMPDCEGFSALASQKFTLHPTSVCLRCRSEGALPSV